MGGTTGDPSLPLSFPPSLLSSLLPSLSLSLQQRENRDRRAFQARKTLSLDAEEAEKIGIQKGQQS